MYQKKNHFNKFSLLLAVLMLASCATPRQMMADKLVDELCAKDGGIKVYETVKLPKEKFDNQGNFTGVTIGKDTQPITDYYIIFEKNYISPYTSGEFGGLSVIRQNIKVYRRKDGKLLGEQFLYERGGGDIVTIDSSSSHSCKQKWTGGEIEKNIFLKETN